MPLTSKLHECGHTNCENETYYYKIVWIPYQEGVRVSAHRGGRGKEAHLYLCPEHYDTMEGEYVIVDVSTKLEHNDF